MIEKKDFTYGNEEEYIDDAYVYSNDDIVLVIAEDIFDDDTIAYANKLVSKYNNERSSLFNQMLDKGLRESYSVSDYSDEYVMNNIGRPQIKIDMKKTDLTPNMKYQYIGEIDFCENEIDGHIVIAEFGDDLNIIRVYIDG